MCILMTIALIRVVIITVTTTRIWADDKNGIAIGNLGSIEKLSVGFLSCMYEGRKEGRKEEKKFVALPSDARTVQGIGVG